MDVKSNKKILVVGDSLSAPYKLPTEKGWVFLLQQRINNQALPYTVINASISGATTAAGKQVLVTSLASHKPDIVVIALGGNDGLQGKPLRYIRDNLTQMIGLANEHGARVMLVGIRLPPNYGPRYTVPFFEQYGVLAAEYKVPLVPFLLEGVAGNDALMMGDGIHPEAPGHTIMLENIWPVIRPML